MRINAGRTKIWVYAREPTNVTFNTNIYLGNHLTAKFSSFKYLGSLITADGRISQEFKQR